MLSIAASGNNSQEVPGGELPGINEIPIVRGYSPEGPEQAQDHEEEKRRRLEEWRSIAANLQGGFTQMPDQVRKDNTLSSNAKLVYEHLLGYMWQKEWCWPGQQRIADELGISRRTVIRACKELYARCYIEKWRRGLGDTNMYFINPLCFVCSFKKPGRGAGVLLHTNAPERSATIENTPAPDVTHSYRVQCQFDTSRSDTKSQQEAPDSHIKHTNTNNNQMIDRSSNDSTEATKGTAIGGKTIRNEQQGTEASKKGTDNAQVPNTVTTPKTNAKPKDIEKAARSSAKTAEAAKVAQKPSAQAQAIAEQTGIPAAHLAALGIAQEPRRRPIPDFITRIMADFTRDLGDSPRSAKSNATRAVKLYYFGVDYCKDAQEDPEGWFLDLLYEKKQAALRVPGVRKRTGNRVNRLPIFFTLLEKEFAFSPDEVIYIRSDLALQEPDE